jgi:hypothetical protein
MHPGNAPVSPNARYRYDTLSPTQQRDARLKARKQAELKRALEEQVAAKRRRKVLEQQREEGLNEREAARLARDGRARGASHGSNGRMDPNLTFEERQRFLRRRRELEKEDEGAAGVERVRSRDRTCNRDGIHASTAPTAEVEIRAADEKRAQKIDFASALAVNVAMHTDRHVLAEGVKSATDPGGVAKFGQAPGVSRPRGKESIGGVAEAEEASILRRELEGRQRSLQAEIDSQADALDRLRTEVDRVRGERLRVAQEVSGIGASATLRSRSEFIRIGGLAQQSSRLGADAFHGRVYRKQMGSSSVEDNRNTWGQRGGQRLLQTASVGADPTDILDDFLNKRNRWSSIRS